MGNNRISMDQTISAQERVITDLHIEVKKAQSEMVLLKTMLKARDAEVQIAWSAFERLAQALRKIRDSYDMYEPYKDTVARIRQIAANALIAKG